ncbi:hypothetical protein LJC48_02995 [Desulfovibrio sp. OttesenSCG-928-C06]|nr:hypothetical protein [Desulfovibrio sp. OttesenSCG-928-C06]
MKKLLIRALALSLCLTLSGLAAVSHAAAPQATATEQLPSFTLHRMETGEGPTLLVIGGIQGEFFGHHGELKPDYEKLGLLPKNVIWHDEAHFILKSADTMACQHSE